jgi:hypothetical protein
MNIADVIGQVFFYGIFITPLLAFLILRKADISRPAKILFSVLLTILLAVIFLVIAINIALRNGLGPDSR